MFCPKCGQQQLSDEVRFCSRCGLQLGSVVKLLQTDEMLAPGSPSADFAEIKERQPLVRRTEIRSGAKVIFASVVLLVPFFALSILFDSAGPLIIPLIAFITGLVQILYFFIFGESIFPQRKHKKELLFKESEQQLYFPPERHSPISAIESNSMTTNELVRPSSVTERTTNLLDTTEPKRH